MSRSELIQVGDYEIEKADEGLECFQNALKATMEVYKKSEGEILPRIWRIVLPEMNDSHAYLQVGETVYNAGVTWTDEKYPDMDIDTLRKKGLDVTTTVLVQTLLELGENYQNKKMGFKEIVENLNPGLTNNQRTVLLDKMIKKSITEERK